MCDLAEKLPHCHPDATDLCCCAIGCDSVASIRAQVADDALLPFCGVHWQEVRSITFRRQVAQVPDRPQCFRAACTTPAVSVMQHLDGTPLPVCEKHLEDLSWVDPTPDELRAMRSAW